MTNPVDLLSANSDLTMLANIHKYSIIVPREKNYIQKDNGETVHTKYIAKECEGL